VICLEFVWYATVTLDRGTGWEVLDFFTVTVCRSN